METHVDFNQKQTYLVLVEENGRRYINEEESQCFKRRYRIGRDYIGPLPSMDEELDISKCHKVIGESPLNYAKKINFLDDVRQLYVK